MVARTLEQEFHSFIGFMNEQGILDSNFDTVCRLQSDDSPHFMRHMIKLYCVEAENMITQLQNSLLEPSVDYENMTIATSRLKRASSEIGGCRVNHACLELFSAIKDRDEKRCLETFHRIADEHNSLRENLCHIIDMEQKLLEFQRRQGQR